MRATSALLGGGRKFLYPKFVWSPSGGWYNDYPKNWDRNALFFLAGAAACAAIVANYSAGVERRPVPALRDLPSHTWYAQAERDEKGEISRF